MIDWSRVKSVVIPQGNVKKIDIDGVTVWEKSVLPSEYQELTYIESTGTQYINTGHIPTIYDSIEAKFLTAKSTSDTILYGSRVASMAHDYTVWINTSKNKGIAVHYPVQSSSGTDTSWFYKDDIQTAPVVLRVTPDYCYVDDVQKYRFNVSRYDYNGRYPAFAFAGSGSGSPFRIGKFKMYYLKIFSGDILQRDFIPCRRISDGEVGMYDLVNDVFYTNSGTGEFTAGNAVA